jgi:hypothetical protein
LPNRDSASLQIVALFFIRRWAPRAWLLGCHDIFVVETE